jgi:enamine deaminase RidA (YjgF/YER057c/UK114 family)
MADVLSVKPIGEAVERFAMSSHIISAAKTAKTSGAVKHLKQGASEVTSFSTKNGAEEFYIVIESRAGDDISAALENLYGEYKQIVQTCGLSAGTHVFCRIFLSDIENQKKILSLSKLYRAFSDAAVSVIGQPSLRGGPISIFSYHLKGPAQLKKTVLHRTTDSWRQDVVVSGVNYSLLWNTNYEEQTPFNAYEQTNTIFHALDSAVNDQGMTLLGNTIRSWVFVRDIDNNYRGMVEARKNFFKRNDLTDETRYLASTGIEGKSRNVNSLVSIDLLSISDLSPRQIVRMEARANMSPTIDYGVTFERGLRVRFGDRSHLYVSGTASIDKKGDVLHQGNVTKQTARAIENVRALLDGQGATLDDLTYLIVYIRDYTAAETVLRAMTEAIPAGLPMIVIQGSVCRSAWLMEIEGVAIIPDNTDFPPFL